MKLILEMTLSGSLMILITLAIRGLLGRFVSRRTISLLWLLCELRLLLPLRLPFTLTFWNLFSEIGQATASINWTSVAISGNSALSRLPDVGSATSAGSSPLALVYGLAALGAGCVFLSLYLAFLHRVRHAKSISHPFADACIARERLRRKLSLRKSEAFSTPLTYGTLRPVILLPEETFFDDTKTLRMILLHELEHVRRFDALRKLSLALCAAIHWFNPLVWLLFFMSERDLEVACDECVVRRLGLPYRKEYALALLKAEEQRSVQLFASCFAKNNLEFRIRSVINMKKRSLLAAVAVLTVALCMFTLFATAASAQIVVEEVTSGVYCIPGAREARTETEKELLMDGELALESTNIYPADVVLMLPDEMSVSVEELRLSDWIDGTRHIEYPIQINRTFYYNYYDILGQVVCTATVTVYGLYYGSGNVDILSVNCSFSGIAASAFGSQTSISGNRATLKISFSGQWIEEKHYVMTNDVIS